jgi:HEPN domain-containing protein
MGSMSEFTKTKIGFALALLGTLFALHPFLDPYADRGFDYLGFDLRIFYAYSLTAALLSLCVYLYAVALMSERPHSWCERTGNHAYALAILVLPMYGGLYLSALLAEQVAVSHVAWAAPTVAIGLGVGWILLSQLVAWRIRVRLGAQDRIAKMAQLAQQEVESLQRARELFESQHYDISVVEAWKALEARLRQVLLSRRIALPADSTHSVIHMAVRKGVLKQPLLGLLSELQRHWVHAVSTEPLPADAAVASLSAVRHILSVTPVREDSTDATISSIDSPPQSYPRAA